MESLVEECGLLLFLVQNMNQGEQKYLFFLFPSWATVACAIPNGIEPVLSAIGTLDHWTTRKSRNKCVQLKRSCMSQ